MKVYNSHHVGPVQQAATSNRSPKSKSSFGSGGTGIHDARFNKISSITKHHQYHIAHNGDLSMRSYADSPWSSPVAAAEEDVAAVVHP